jgi:hypothetical protein
MDHSKFEEDHDMRTHVLRLSLALGAAGRVTMIGRADITSRRRRRRINRLTGAGLA